MKPTDLEVLYEDNHLLAVNKPAGLPTQGSLPGQSSLAQVAKQYIKSRYQKPGNVYLGVVSRLDARVTGVVVLARTSKAAARLNVLMASHEVRKTYWAILERQPQPASDRCIDWLWHDDAAHRVVVASPDTVGAKESSLTYTTVGAVERGWLVEIQLETGRKHQIRVQFASRGWPIVGDQKYGSTRRWQEGIALHARQLHFVHPVGGSPISLVAPLPRAWHGQGIRE